MGESRWTFDARNRQALHELERRGFVNCHSGTVPHTLRASLTLQGRTAALDDRYRPPKPWSPPPLNQETPEDVCQWLVSMDDVESPTGMQERRTITMNAIITRARAALGRTS